MVDSVLVPGRSIPVATATKQSSEVGPVPEVVVQVTSARDGAMDPVAVQLADDDVVEVELTDGVILFQRKEDLLRQARVRRGGAEVELPATLDFGPRTRSGGGSLAVRFYRFFTGKAAADLAVDVLAAKIEGEDTDRLKHWVAPDKLVTVAPEELTADQPMLVLIHGTFSSTMGSFGAFGGQAAGGASWDQLNAAFEGRVYGFDHRTLTADPLQNAVDLMQQLPKGARLHLLTHSRGGLVGEVLCRCQRAAEDASPFDDVDEAILDSMPAAARKRALAAVKKLVRLIRQKNIRIEGFVRVACPARGTVLASERLDLYLSLVFNLMRALPGPYQVAASAIRRFVREVVRSRTDPDQLPGLEAMMPGSAMISMLNRADVEVEGSLHVVAGDAQPGGLWTTLKVIAADVFYGEDNDLVVSTADMEGGAPRRGGVAVFGTRGRDVSHFSYFGTQRSATYMIEALRGDVPVPLPDPEVLVARSRGETHREVHGDKPVCILLPGIMGTDLRQAGSKVWANPLAIMFGGVEAMCAPGGKIATDVEPAGANSRYYGGLMRHLLAQGDHDVMVCDFDWRLSLTEAADRLNGMVQEALDKTRSGGHPVRLLAHSMGGLVARTMIATHPDTWAAMHNGRHGSRLVMLGTPNAGSMAMAAGLLGQDSMIRKLALADVTNSLGELLSAMTPLPGVLELLPRDENDRYLSPAFWRSASDHGVAGLTLPRDKALDKARRVLGQLTAPGEDARHMVYLAGKAALTPVMIETGPLKVFGTPAGDGRVTWRSGQLPGVPTWYAPTTEHGDLSCNQALFPAILDLVRSGETARLSQTPPALRGDEDVLQEMRLPPTTYPSEDEMRRIGMGGGAGPKPTDAVGTRCRVSLCHGDLRLHSGIIAVGHYREAGLINAERALDEILGGALSRNRMLDLYPGDLRTAELFRGMPEEIGPDGALVIGLGQLGELSPSALTQTLTQAFLRFAMGQQHAPSRKLTTLLIGHRDSIISIRESVEATLTALATANGRLADTDCTIDELCILELYEDTAIEASEALQALAEQDRFAGGLRIDPVVMRGEAGRRRARFSRDEEWDQVVQVRTVSEAADDSGTAPRSLFYSIPARSAMVRVGELSINLEQVDRLMKEPPKGIDDEVTGKMLFQHLIPAGLKPVFKEGRNLVLQLDEAGATYPWEMLRLPDSGEEIAIKANMLRQMEIDLDKDRPPLGSNGQVLIIANPLGAGLDAAAVEGTTLRAAFLDDIYSETAPEGDRSRLRYLEGESTTNLNALMLDNTRVLHFAGHGVHEMRNHALRMGLVLGDGDLLTSASIKQARTVPEFVFLNSCFGGKVDAEAPTAPHELMEIASNLAVSYMKLGSKAVIAAGWAIDDTAAQTFATTFYQHFLQGVSFRDAVHEARRKIQDPRFGGTTWGAYQCYGDPQYTLTGEAARPPVRLNDKRAEPSLTAIAQAVAELGSLRLNTRFIKRPEQAAYLQDKLDQLESAIAKRDGWGADAELLEAMAAANSELGRRARAIELYRRATRSTPPLYSVESLETMLELELREAIKTRHETELAVVMPDQTYETSYTAAFAKLVEEEREANAALLRALDGAGATVIRHLRAGDTLLRAAALERAEDTLEPLRHARDAYVQAAGLVQQNHPGEVAHVAIRKAVAEYFISRASDAALPDAVKEEVSLVVANLRTDHSAPPDFDRCRLQAEAHLFYMLNDPSSPGINRAQVIEDFNRAFRGGASVRAREEVVDDLRLVAELLERTGLRSNRDGGKSAGKGKTTQEASGPTAAEVVRSISAELGELIRV